jgi:hypothetical protein
MRLLDDELDSVKSNALSAIMYITIANSGKFAIVEADGIPRLLELLKMEDEKVLINVLQVPHSKYHPVHAPVWFVS